MQAATIPQRLHHVGGDGAFVETLAPCCNGSATSQSQARMPEDVALVRRVTAGRKRAVPFLRSFASRRFQSRDLLVNRPAVGGKGDRRLQQSLQILRPCAFSNVSGTDGAGHGDGMADVFSSAVMPVLLVRRCGGGRRAARAVQS